MRIECNISLFSQADEKSVRTCMVQAKKIQLEVCGKRIEIKKGRLVRPFSLIEKPTHKISLLETSKTNTCYDGSKMPNV